MTPAELDRVFGRGRLRMVTGDHVEVFREASAPGERRRYTKRFLATPDGDFREWTEREWRILARLVGHGLKPVPEIVQFDRGSADRPALVQTYDAGVTVDHWATLLPLERDGVLLKNVFEDCAHWWALARHALVALDAVHELGLVHLDLKADNVCIPVGPAGFDPRAGNARALHPRFDDLTLIDFAFSLVSGERLTSALPIAAQPDYEYQSPRLLQALEIGRAGDLGMTRHLDWRCDFFSLAAMLWRYLPEPGEAADRAWTPSRHARAGSFVRRLIEIHDLELPAARPHALLITLCTETLAAPDLKLSLQRGWTLAGDTAAPVHAAPTPITRIAPPLPVPLAAAVAVAGAGAGAGAGAVPSSSATPVSPEPFGGDDDAGLATLSRPMHVEQSDIDARAERRSRLARKGASRWWWGAGVATAAAVASAPWLRTAWQATHDAAPRAATTVAIVEPAAQAPRRAVVAPVAVKPPAPASTQAPVPAPAPVKPTATLVAKPTTRPAPLPAPAPAPMPAPTRAIPRSPAAATVADTRAAARSARAAGADAAAAIHLAQQAKAQEIAAALARARAARGLAPAAPVASPMPMPMPMPMPTSMQARASAPVPAAAPAGRSGDGPTPWAVAGRSPPAASPVPAPAEAVAMPLPVAAAPEVRNVSLEPPGDSDRPDYGARADEIMAAYVPKVAQRAERVVSRTLFLAGRADNVVGDGEVSGSAAALGRGAGDAPSLVLAMREAESLHAAARSEFGRRGASREAMALQVRAFGANPVDPSGAGYLAFLLVRQRPAQAEAARQLALYALTMHGSRYPIGRAEDWATLAVANALLGRERDARNALLVSLAASPSVERQCRAALDLVAVYGERLRLPAEAVLRSAQASGTQPSSPCEWPLYRGETTSTR